MKRIRLLVLTAITIMALVVQTAGFAAWTGKDPGTNFSAPGGPPDNKSPLSGSVSWTEVQPAGNADKYWVCSSVSANGSKMLAGVGGGRLYLSSDYGNNWNETQPANDQDKDWMCVSVSADGSVMIAGVSPGRLYISSDGGTNWSETNPGGDNDMFWNSLSASYDGSIIMAVDFGDNSLYLSKDKGVTWTTIAPELFKYYWYVSVSSDGNKLLATNDRQYINISTNAGYSWNWKNVTGGYDWLWTAASISADGSTLMAATQNYNQNNTVGRIFLSRDDGNNWSETQPVGDENRDWNSVALSGNGAFMLAGIYNGRLYLSKDGGGSWQETKPKGESDGYWKTLSVSVDGRTMLVGDFTGRLYKGTLAGPPEVEFYGAPVFSSITVNSSNATGKIVSTNGANASHRGGIVYEYTGTDKINGDAGVTQVDSTGNFGTGEFPVSFTGLSANTRYNARVYATNSNGTGYSDREDFWTLTNVPGVPTLISASATSLNLVLNANSNPSTTQFAIQDSVAGTYVQANGTLAATAVWQTAATWDTVTITGLTTGSTYYFRVKAKNGDGVETTFGISASGISMTVPTINYPISGGHWEETMPAGNVDKNWISVRYSSDGSTILAGVYGGRLYKSTNEGVSWQETRPAGNTNKWWYTVSVSADGNKMLAGVEGGRLYKSTDAGNTWSEIQPAGNNNFDWQSVSISGDGTRILAGITLGRLYFSSNSGTSWNELQLAGNTNMGWPTVSISSDGNTMLAGAYMYKLYKSTNGGVTWNETQPAGNLNKNWYTTCIANNGSLMLAGVYNGRLYNSTNAGTSWSETQPAGNVNKSWVSSSVSTDGSHLLAGASVGRLYKSTDGGISWSETQPAGNSDKRWVTSTITSDGGNMVAGVFGGRLYRWVNEYQNVTAIAETSATGNGKIFSLQGGGNATNRGVIYYPYTNSEKIIGDADVTNISENGSFGIGDYTESLSGLSVNTHYNTRAHATNAAGTGYGTRGDFWTLANVPAAPVLSNHSPTSLLLCLSTNGNPAATEFAIQDSIAGTYVQADGTRAATAVWQTAANWDTVTITGLTSGTTCYFMVKAKNGNGVETAFGISASGTPIAAPTVEFPSVISWSETQPAGNADKLWATSSISEDGNRILAGINYGRLYLSTNGGTSWGEMQPAGNADKYWQSSSVSADGNTMLAGVYAGRLYLSNNGGTSWSETQPAGNADKVWSISSISADVSKILAGVDAGRLYLSSNGGTSWSEVQPAGNVNSRWVAGSVSNDGNTMLAGVYNGRLYKSTNGGLSWSETRPAGDSIRYWQTVSISADGKIMLAGINNGRLYLSTNKGTSWTETRPSGNENKNWGRTAVSADGSRMLAGVATGRLYMSTNGGISWNETQPAGNIDKFWVQVNISSDSKKMLACVMGGRLYSGNLPLTVSDLTTTSATATGYISSINGDTATNRGIIHYPYTNTNKIIGDASVTNISETGSFGIGNFTASLTGLSVNTHYNLRAHATNTVGTGYCDRSDFWTLANPPEAPIIESVGATTVYLTFGTNANPAITEFAVKARFGADTNVVDKYVNAATGALQDTEDWQTSTSWSNIAATGLETGLQYIFTIKARNGANVETAFSDTASAVPVSKPVVCAFGNSFWNETQPAGNSNKNWQTVSVSADGMTMLAGDFIGRLYLSNDKGNTWSEIQPAGDNDLLWVKVSVSGDGSTLLAGVQGGRLYLSTDGGITWSETQPAGNINADWVSLASSTDGSAIMAGISATRLYFSSNRGSSWTEVQPGGDYDYDWRSVAVSGNGNKILAAAKNKRLYLSTDHCTSWNEVQPAGDVDKKWQTVSISTDGTVLIAGANTGRLYLSTDGGLNWSEQQPAGAADKKWQGVTVSSDGSKILAGVLLGRLYESNDTGATWSEVQPAGNADKQWTGVAMAANSMISLTGIVFERLYVSDYAGTDNNNSHSARGVGKIQSIEGADVTNRGFIWYPFTNTDKEMGDANVTNVDESGAFGTGIFTPDITGLSCNTHYNIRAHATNYKGTSYSDRKDFWTLANVPEAPTVINPTAISLDVAVNPNGNPASTLFAIQDSALVLQYVKADGTRGASAIWQTAAAWDTTTVTGLETGVTYYFRVKAKNGDDVETAFGLATGQNTCSNPTIGGRIGTNQTICYGTKPSALTNVTLPSNFGGTLEYKWQYSTDSLSFTDIVHDSIGYAPGNLTDTTWYKRLAKVTCKDNWTGAAESNMVKITVRPQFTAGAIETTGETICSNGDPAQIGDSISATGGDASISYQWQISHTSATAEFTDILNATSASYDPPSGLTDTTWYRRQAKDGTCNTDWETSTGVWKVRIETIPPTALANDTTLYLDSNGTISVTAEAIDNGSTDNCSIASYSLDKSTFDCTDLGTNPVILTVTDNAGNSATANSVVTIVDTITPVAIAKDITIILDPYGNASITGVSIDNGSSDNCSITLTASRTTFDCSDRGPNSVTLTVADTSGNTATANSVVTVVEGTALLPPWVNANTAGAANGSSTYSPCTNNGTFYLTSKGLSTTTNDVMHFVYQPLTGNGTIITRIADIKNDGWAGVMMRESCDPNAKTILFKTRLYNPTVIIGTRTTTGKSITNTSQSQPNLRWMKIQRNGNTFQVFVSANGTSWTRAYTANIAMNNTIYAGIFTDNYTSSKTTQAWFDKVELSNTLKSGDDFTEAEILIEANEKADVQIYPNPAKEQVNINLPGWATCNVSLFSSEGKVLKTFTISTIETKLDVQDLKPGLYILRFENEEDVVIKRLVIN